MRNEPTTSSTHSAPSTTSYTRQDKLGDVNHQHENAQRFRKLLDGKNGKDDAQAQGVDDAQGQDAADGAAKKFSLEQQNALRDMLQRQLDAASGKTAVLARDDSEGDGGESKDSHDGDPSGANLGMQILQQNVQAAQFNAQQPDGVAAQSAFTPALAELIERHVKQLLVPDATSQSSAQSREIMISLKDGLLPNTELWLSRTPTGWRLRADTRSTDAYRSLVDGAPQLIKRFADSRLGELEVDPALLS